MTCRNWQPHEWEPIQPDLTATAPLGQQPTHRCRRCSAPGIETVMILEFYPMCSAANAAAGDR